MKISKIHGVRELAAWGAMLLIAGGCGEAQFKIEGTLTGADKEKVVLEKADYSGRWQIVDSTRTDSEGRFKISHIAPTNPEIYRLGAGDQWVYLPVDSTETITVTAPLKNFATNFTLSGSLGAEKMEKFEKQVQALGQHPDGAILEDFRRKVYTDYLQDARGSILSYYILTKTVDGRPLFDATDPQAVKYVAAVASSFKEFRPDDPRVQLLENAARNGLRQRNASKGYANTVEAEEIGFFDITLPDENGKPVSLSEVAGKGKETLLVFTLMNHPDSPEVNRRVRQISAAQGLNVFMVSFDADQYDWRDGAVNLPWTTVYDGTGEQSQLLTQYNIQVLPTAYLIDERGQIVKRMEGSEIQ